MAYVYRHIRLDKNEVFYIGISLKNDPKYKRAYTKHGRNDIWHRIVSKAGYEVHIMMDGLTEDEVKEKEKEFILLYGRKDLGTGTLANLTSGGDGQLGFIQSEERRKISSERMKGEKNPMFGKYGELHSVFGKKKSQESIEKHRQSLIGFKHTEETLKKMSESKKGELNSSYGKRGELSPLFGRTHKDESKEKLSKMRQGENNPMFGKSGELSPRSRPVLNLYTGIFYVSVKEAHEYIDVKISIGHFRKMLLGQIENKTPYRYA